MRMPGSRISRAFLGGVTLLLAACGGEGDQSVAARWSACGIAES